MYFVQIIGFNIYIYSKYLCCISQHILFHIYTKVISLPGSTVPGTLQARTLKWVAIFLLQCVKVKSESEVTQSCPTLSDPMDCSITGSSVHGIFQARVLEQGAIAFSGIISQYYLKQKCYLKKRLHKDQQKLMCPLSTITSSLLPTHSSI